MKLYIIIIGFLLLLITISSFTCKQDETFSSKTFYLDSLKKDSILIDSLAIDSATVSSTENVTFYKAKAHASYYHDKFNGRKTASGQKFNNNLYTAAHRKFKFGTKLKVTNVANGKSVIVTVNDRGPFVKGREIDLSKKAFMEIAKNKNSGYLEVNIEILNE